MRVHSPSKHFKRAVCTLEEFEATAVRVSMVSIVGNTVLSIFKFLAGIFAHSGAMVSDAVHSASDVFSSVIVIIGVKLSTRASDKEHPYGHERFECVAAIVLAFILFVTGLFIGHVALERIGTQSALLPGKLALIAAIVSIIVKEAMFWYTRFYAKDLDSGALMADAWHHRSDAFSSIGTAAGIGGAILLGDHWRVLDPVAAVIVSFFIMKVAVQLLIPCVDELLEKSLPAEVEDEILKTILSFPGISSPHHLRTRRIGSYCAIEVHVRMDGSISLEEAHETATAVENKLKRQFGKGTLVSIHVEPVKKSNEATE